MFLLTNQKREHFGMNRLYKKKQKLTKKEKLNLGMDRLYYGAMKCIVL